MYYFSFHFNIILYLTKHTQEVPKMYTHFKRCYLCITFDFILILYLTILYLTKYIQGVPKMYTHFKICYLCITFRS